MTVVELAKKVLVTGASGYIGRHVVRALLDRGAEVIAIDRETSSARRAIDARAQLVSADVFAFSDEDFEALGSPDACIHLAWEAGFTHASPTHMLRLSDHYRFLSGLVDRGIRRLAVVGTMHEVGYHEGRVDADTPTNPLSQYGVAKDALRKALAADFEGTDVVFQWLRCFYVIGDEENSKSVFSRIAAAARQGQTTFPFTTGTRKFDFIHVEELGRQIAAAASQDEVRGVIHCGSGTSTELRHMVDRFIAERGFNIELLYGAFPDRQYDSPAIWADTTAIHYIMSRIEAGVTS
ncbi:NAD-dependent epimerase/dehydratase family protein [Luethyella okanaganae]|uniref:NAD-dependent epimerase/dehydratase family protein n=1 Tax=Luethyella okanaganae TaxID=69372 RepID=A0ABW1VJ86_9MICO